MDFTITIPDTLSARLREPVTPERLTLICLAVLRSNALSEFTEVVEAEGKGEIDRVRDELQKEGVAIAEPVEETEPVK